MVKPILKQKPFSIETSNTIEKNLPKIIEYFVKFYGENYREVITQRLNSAIYVYADKMNSRNYSFLKIYYDDLFGKLARMLLCAFKVKDLQTKSKELVDCFKNMDKLEKCVHNLNLVNSPEILSILNCFELFGGENVDFVNLSKLDNDAKENLKTIIEGIVQLWKENKYLYLKIKAERDEAIPPEIEEKILDLPEKEKDSRFNELKFKQIVWNLHQEDLLFEHDLLKFLKDYVHNPSEVGAVVFPTAKRDNLKKFVPVCITRGFYNDYTSFIIHELNHILESKILSASSKKITIKSGFFEAQTDLTTGKNLSITPYVYFNEAINEFLSKSIYQLMEKDGFYLSIQKYNESAYSIAIPLLEPFIKDNFEDIIDCRINKTYKDFAKIIGKDNYEKLAKVTHALISANNINGFFEDAYEEIKIAMGENTDIYEFLDNPEKHNLSEKAQNYLTYFDSAKAIFRSIKKYKQKQFEKQQVSKSKATEEETELE